MPCNCDHLHASQLEEESRIVAIFLCYVYKCLNKQVDKQIKTASKDYYGNDIMANVWTAELCSLIRNMTKEQEDTIVYNARNKTARELASWWEDHKIADLKREKSEKAQTRKDNVKNKWNKLTLSQQEELLNKLKN